MGKKMYLNLMKTQNILYFEKADYKTIKTGGKR